jgi:hypothetical protein
MGLYTFLPSDPRHPIVKLVAGMLHRKGYRPVGHFVSVDAAPLTFNMVRGGLLREVNVYGCLTEGRLLKFNVVVIPRWWWAMVSNTVRETFVVDMCDPGSLNELKSIKVL